MVKCSAPSVAGAFKRATFILDTSMSAIVIIYTTPGGFVIAADGRVHHATSGEILSDDAQKIFAVRRGHCNFAVAAFGDLQSEKDYDLRNTVRELVQELCLRGVEDFSALCGGLATGVEAELVRANKSGQLAPAQSEKQIAEIHLAGYYKGRAEWRRFSCERNGLDSITVNPQPISLQNGQSFVMGGKNAPQSALAGDSTLAKYRFFLNQNLKYITLNGAADYAKAFIGCCSDSAAQQIDPYCKFIGGRFHMLEITQKNSRWLYAPQNVITAKSKITINTEGISDEQKATAKFQSAYDDMLEQLNAPGFIPVLCAHEAAHVVFFAIAGLKEYDPYPARITYDPTIDDYSGSLAAIQLLDLPHWTEGDFWTWFLRVACGHAAGGVVARRLLPSSDGGDQDDKERFERLCEMFNQDPKVRMDFEEWWKKAQSTVTEMLDKKPEIMDVINQQALELRPQFGL